MADVFVSYSRRDAEFVGRLARDLEERGKDVWVDVEGIRDAEVFPQALQRAIEASDAFVFVISPEAVRSPFCEQEVSHAAQLNKRIVPLALRAVPEEEIPDEIRYRNWIPVDGDGDGDGAVSSVDRLVAAIDTDLEWERQHTRLTVKALEWDQSGRDRSFLLRGSDLVAGERWLAAGAARDRGATALQQEYLLAGRAAASRRQRGLVGASLGVAAVAVGLLIFALISRGQAVAAKTGAQAQALAAVSETQQSVDPERAVLLAMTAARMRATYGPLGTMFALRAAIDASAIRYRLPNAGTQGCGSSGVVYDPAPRSNVLAEGLCDGEIRFADATTGRVIRTVRTGSGPAMGLLYTADGSALVDAVGDQLRELDPTTGAVQATSPHLSSDVSAYTVDPRAPVVAAVGHDFYLWNLRTGRLTKIPPPRGKQFGRPSGVAFAPDGRRLAIVFDSGPPSPGLIVADVARRRIVASLRTPAEVAAYSPDGRTLAVGEFGSTNGSIDLLNAATLKREPGFSAVRNPDVEPSALAFSPNGRDLAYGFADGTAGLVDAATGRPIESYAGDSASISSVSFRPDGRLVVTASQDGTARAWRVGGLMLSAIHPGGDLADVESSQGGFVTLSSPGPRPGQGVVAQRWLSDGQPAAPPLVLSRTPNVDAGFLGLAGRLAAVIPLSGSSPTGQLRLFDVTERKVVRRASLRVPSGPEPVISPNGRLVAMEVQVPSAPTGAGTYDLDVLNLATGVQRVIDSEASCGSGWRGLAFSPSSAQLAAGTFGGTDIRVWDLATGRPAGPTLNLGGGELAWIAFRPDGRQLAVASWNGTIEVSPVPVTGRVRSLTENTKGVPSGAYSRDGRYLASAGLDHTVRIFDARSLAELRVIAQPAAAYGLTFAGADVMSWGADGTVWRWDACADCESPRALLALARKRVTRGLTAAERRTFGVG
ncbi:MAG: toll/interleukin-1 receptor domain-containing protein [Solirubrobacteraceae bacterium]